MYNIYIHVYIYTKDYIYNMRVRFSLCMGFILGLLLSPPILHEGYAPAASPPQDSPDLRVHGPAVAVVNTWSGGLESPED